MHDETRLIEDRVSRSFRDLLEPALVAGRSEVPVTLWEAPDEPVTFDQAVAQGRRPCPPGTRWGRPWGTAWFEVRGTLPAGCPSAELVIDIGFDDGPGFTCEGLVRTLDGRVVKGLNPENAWVPLDGVAPGEEFAFLVEAGANPGLMDMRFRPTPLGDPTTAGAEPRFTFRGAWLQPVDDQVRALALESRVVWETMHEVPGEYPRRHQLLRALEAALEALDPEDPSGSAPAARAALAPVLAAPATASAHVVHAVGNAHIDTAWLWPLRETRRKVARTFANALALLDSDPDFTFAASAAQHHQWLAEDHPALLDRVREHVRDGRWCLVGGQWVEPDGNMCGGEALARQFVQGQRWFEEHLGERCRVMWLPDSFGYTAAYPQLARLAGCTAFLTQKLSWNRTNTFPHHTFRWEGIDGTRVLTHFPPADTYEAGVVSAELKRSERRYAEKGLATCSLLPYGYGDGGGGPTREMLGRARLLAGLEGLPRLELSTPERFFDTAGQEYPDAPVWRGELYLEGHRGTLTSQLGTKQGNRRNEHLLREAELAATMATLRAGRAYPYDELTDCWRTVLMLQFHDILPGTSIAWVHDEAERLHAEVRERLEAVLRDSLGSLGAGSFTALPCPGRVVVDRAGRLELLDAATGAEVRPEHPVSVGMGPDGIVIANRLVAATIGEDGTLVSLVDRTRRREVLPSGERGAVLQLHDDRPSAWDAWDVDRHYLRSVTDLLQVESVRLLEQTSLRATVEVRRRFGASEVIQRYTVDADSPRVDMTFDISWQERRKLLKLAVPMALMADEHRAEIQFGHVRRPTHENTSWDRARFEVAAHRWLHVGEEGFGVAVANDSTYGHDVRRDTREDGQVVTTVRLSLLRAATFPDPEQDRGFHGLRVSLVPGAGVPEAIAAGYALNLPVRVTGDGPMPEPVVTSSDPGVVVEAVKLAEDRSGDVVVRLYEALGGRRTATLALGFDAVGVVETDLLEDELPGAAAVGRHGGRDVTVTLRPFQVVTLRFRR